MPCRYRKSTLGGAATQKYGKAYGGSRLKDDGYVRYISFLETPAGFEPIRFDMKLLHLARFTTVSLCFAASLARPVVATQVPGAQPPQPSAKPNAEKLEKCKISGMVVKASDGSPLKNATVTLVNDGDLKHQIAAKTGSDGRFELRNIPPDRYSLNVYRSGYVDLSYGQRKTSDPGAVFALAPGQTKTDLLFKMSPAAVISGRVLDEDGGPAQDVAMVAAREQYREGKKVTGRKFRGTTDDRGAYRIYGLAPGKYFVSATEEPWMQLTGDKEFSGDAARAEPDQGYAETYYPGTNDFSGATPIVLKEGDEYPGIDFSLKKVRVHRVRGKVINAMASSQQSESIAVFLVPRTKIRTDGSINSTYVRTPENTFDLPNVEPGSYLLVAEWYSDNGPGVRGTQKIEVGDSDLDGVTVTIETSPSIAGRIQWDGKPCAAAHRPMVWAQLADGGAALPAGRGTIGANEQFVLKNALEGDLHIGVSGLGKDCYLKKISFGQASVINDVIIFARGASAPLEITLSSRGARVQGRVVDKDGLPAAGAWVVAVPDEARWSLHRLFKSETTDQYGKFDLHGLAPGEYKLYSWDGAENGEWEDRDFLKPFEAQGVKIEVRDDDAKEVNLTMIAMKASGSN